ncbi:MAG: DUF1592 domain-containing protein, partial [Pirellula sp.]|nr:DUF1592 domain-containing protein [Pirellula sp.]
ATRNQQFVEQIQPVLKQVCFDCHSGSEASAGLSLVHFETARAVFKERSTWEKVAQRIEIGDMPPPDAEPMSDADRKKVVDWIRETLNDIDCGKTPNPGSVTLRRLNRNEYRNTVKDLFGIDYQPAANFPGDDVGYGFDNIGDVLTLPPLLMEKYVRAAEEITSQIIQAPEPGPVFESLRNGTKLSADSGGHADGQRFVFSSNGTITIEEQIPWPGKYTLEMGMAGTAAVGQYPKVVVSLDGKKLQEWTVVTDSANDPKTFQIPLRLRTGKRTLTFAFTNDKYIEAKNGKPAEDTNLYIYDVRIIGQKPPEPLNSATLPPWHRENIKDSVPSASKTASQASGEILRKVASRAFRRPVTEEELTRLTGLVQQATDDGDSYESGLQLAISAVLVSPSFLFKVEEPGENQRGEYPLVSEFELATRLSYFLWSSTPDRELLTLAAKKQLRQPEVLKQQIDRMVRDDRARDFVRNFAGQWLTLRKLDGIEPNPNLFPQWNEEIRDLVRAETYLFFLNAMRENLNVVRLLDADYSFMNETLARYYGVPGVEGDKFRKVSLKGQKRMGLLTHASVLAVTSNPTRTSPVKRGKWILDNILGTPPPPAPPGVPELEKEELVGTLRQRMEQHRANPACASCHKLMDPLGLALENYDAVGRWRTQDAGQDIDTKGEFPTGEPIRNPGDLIRIIRDNKSERFVRTLTEKLMVYALGRGLEYYDRCAVDKIMAAAAQEDYRFQSLIYQIVTSDPFQRKGTREEP